MILVILLAIFIFLYLPGTYIGIFAWESVSNWLAKIPNKIVTSSPISRQEYIEKYHNPSAYKILKTTCGTVKFAYSKKDWAKLQANLLQIFNEEFCWIVKELFFRKIRFTVVVPKDQTTDLLTEPIWFGSFLVIITKIPFDTDEREIASMISGQDIVHMYSGILNGVSVYFDKITFPPKIITTGSEYLSKIARRQTARLLLKTRLIETYGCSECPCIASGCKKGVLHLNQNTCIIELVKLNLEPTQGISDSILITNLINTTQPVQRYIIDDQIEFLEECSCGNKSECLRFHGRYRNNLWLKNKKITTSMIDDRLGEIEGLINYQIILGKSIEAKCQTVNKKVLTKVRDMLQRLLKNSVIVTRVKRIERDPISFKLEHVINNVSR